MDLLQWNILTETLERIEDKINAIGIKTGALEKVKEKEVKEE